MAGSCQRALGLFSSPDSGASASSTSSASSCSSAAQLSLPGHGPPFDLVVFNYPHLGVEDCRRHQLLLAHFFAYVYSPWRH